METLQSTIFIEFDVNTKKITFLRKDNVIDYDSNVTNVYVRVKYKNLNGNTVYLTPSELEGYKFSLYTIKPATNNVNEIIGEVTDELKENVNGGVVKFKIPRACTNRLGIVKCEIHINQENKRIASIRFILDVKQSLVTEFDDALLEDEDFPVLKQLILEIQKGSNIDDDNISKITTYSSDKIEIIRKDIDSQIKENNNKVENIKEDLSSQIENIENKRLVETDYVDLVENQLYFSKMSLIKTHDGRMQQFDVFLKNDTVSHKYTFVKPDDYFKLSGCEISTIRENKTSINAKINDVTINGEWYTGIGSQTWYAKTANNSTLTYNFTVNGTANMSLQFFNDDRGGIWEISLDGVESKTISTYNSSIVTKIYDNVFTGITQGAHIITMVFKGDDPSNTPSTGRGTSRGWTTSETINGASQSFITITDKTTEATEAVKTLADTSNKEFAFSVSPIGSTNKQWIPKHANATAFKKVDPVFVLDGKKYSLSDFKINKEVFFNDFKLIQSIYGRNPDSGDTNLVEINTTHTINNKGKINVTGFMEVLQDINMSSSYVIMCPVNNNIFKTLNTGLGNSYSCLKSDGTSTILSEGRNCKNYIFLSDSDYVVAFRHTNIKNNLIYNSDLVNKNSNFVNHRDSNLVKHYINIFADQVLSAGYKYRWSGDYITGYIENSNNLFSV